MVKAPRKICRKPGCGELTHNTYCGKHEKQKEETKKAEIKRYDQLRGSSASRGYDYRWRKYSQEYRKQHPLCVMCEQKGLLKLAQCVDHIIAVDGPDDPLFWVESNHQSLCHDCHNYKTDSIDGGMGNKKK